jgi:predicted lysophospholipase L1 biosynthesis ABC-type transport system permease subunit
MHTFLRLALPFIATAAAYALLVVIEWLFHDLRSTLRQLVGPKSPEFFFGNIKQMEVALIVRCLVLKLKG